ncbi:hypothetical protein [Streptomyces sp. NBC_00344]|uniref:hypothetical protein n=1 Tax=Streptomyces sp. NBC_00344 TaxID=2975720 RepID=UPI002E2100A2
MPGSRPRVRGAGALTRKSVRRGERPARPETGAAGGRLRYLSSPVAWLATIVLGVATVTFQDALTTAVKAVLPLDGLHDRLSTRDALQVVEVRDVKDSGTFLARGPVDPHFVNSLETASLAARADLLDVNNSQWLVTLRSGASQEVRVTDIVPVIEGGRCGKPLGGSLVYAPGQGGEEVLPLDVTVDAPVPRLHKDGAKGPYFTGPEARQIVLKQNQSTAFLLRASVQRGHCRWHYRVHYQVGGKTAEAVLSAPHGHPFEITGELPDAGDYRAVYLPTFLCPNSKEFQPGWRTADGQWFARGPGRGKSLPCPKD